MILYSTLLPITPALTPQAFIDLVLEWNRSDTHEENRIPDLAWNGEDNIRCGNDSVWLEIATLRPQSIVGVRYEKKDHKGTIWDTDYVADFAHRCLVIQLDRTYTEEALRESLAFSTPHFITLLMEKGYLALDGQLPITREPLVLAPANLPLWQRVIQQQDDHHLPLVYLSQTREGGPAVDLPWLGSKLKGAAHLVTAGPDVTEEQLQQAGFAEQNGAVGIYYPRSHRTIAYQPSEGARDALLEKVAQTVLEYGNMEEMPQQLTWFGVKQALLDQQLQEQAEKRKQVELSSKQELQDFITAFDEDQETLKKQNQDLLRQNHSLEQEIRGLRAKLENRGRQPVLYLGEEREYYPGEIREMLLDAVEQALQKNCQKGTRRYDVLADILAHNPYEHIREQRDQTLKQLFKGYRTLTPAIRAGLKELGITISGDGKHYRLTYYGDERYKDTMSKTGSDSREGLNKVKQILNKMM
ncbi:MAG: hypothetical protein ACI3X3_02025 [Acidaminococcus sp.]|uniref:hypothetical protein n=1 Tax=Acidaminococcus sp. TaxID=1872103 RepID=UPI003F172C61